jgi:hypothetical protein
LLIGLVVAVAERVEQSLLVLIRVFWLRAWFGSEIFSHPLPIKTMSLQIWGRPGERAVELSTYDEGDGGGCLF